MPKRSAPTQLKAASLRFSADMMELAKQERTRRGWSQSRLAERMGVSQTIISTMERHPERVTIDRLYLLFHVLDLTLAIEGIQDDHTKL